LRYASQCKTQRKIGAQFKFEASFNKRTALFASCATRKEGLDKEGPEPQLVGWSNQEHGAIKDKEEKKWLR
jgi:hypothetical protein